MTGKQDKVSDWLKSEIFCGRLAPGTKIPSEYDLGDQLGVNKTTANKAVAQLVAEGLLVRHTRGAGTFVTEGIFFKGSFIALMSISHPYFALIAHGIAQAAFGRGYNVNLCTPPPELLGEILSSLDSRQTKGILTCSYGKIELKKKIPVIHLDMDPGQNKRIDRLIWSDCLKGAYLVTREFITNGHSNLVYVGSRLLPSRADGFLKAINETGNNHSLAERVFFHDGSSAACVRLLSEILRKNPKVTGIITGSDNDAFMLSKAGKSYGLAIPGDISLSGFGNCMAICDALEMTSVEQHPIELGACAVERLCGIIEGRSKEDTLFETIRCEVVRRHSIKRI
jgi:GntR family transcriptional regulator of arabinose operon